MMWCIFENLLFDQMVIVSSNSCFSAELREVLVSAFKHYYMLWLNGVVETISMPNNRFVFSRCKVCSGTTTHNLNQIKSINFTSAMCSLAQSVAQPFPFSSCFALISSCHSAITFTSTTTKLRTASTQLLKWSERKSRNGTKLYRNEKPFFTWVCRIESADTTQIG